MHVAGGLRFEEVNTVTGEIPSGEIITIEKDLETETHLSGLMEIETDEIKDTSTTVYSDTSFVNGSTQINDQLLVNEYEPGLLVYPNPGTGDFTIQYDVLKRANVRIDIFDLQGAWIRTIVNIPEQYEGKYQIPLHLNELANGIYLVNMINEGKRYTEKLIIEK